MYMKSFEWFSPDDRLPKDGEIVLVRPKIYGSQENEYFGMYDVCQYSIASDCWDSIADADMTEYITDAIMCWSYIPEP